MSDETTVDEILRLKKENEELKIRISALVRELDSIRKTQGRQRKLDADRVPYDNDDD